MFSVFHIIAFEPVCGFSLMYEENTCDRQSMCYQIHVIFVIRRVFVCVELSSKLELKYVLYN